MSNQEVAKSVPALRRAAEILDLVSSSGSRLSAAEITRACNLPKSTGHQLLLAMTDMSLLNRAQDGTYQVGPHPMRWASSFLSTIDIVGTFQSCLGQVHELDGFTVTLTVREDREVVYIGCRNSNQPLGQTFRIGMRLPAPFTATGKILLSDLADAELAALFSEGFPVPLTPRGTPDLNHLRDELNTTRARGYSIDDGHVREGMICIGAAIRDHSGRAIAGIAVSLLRSETSAEMPHQLGLTLMKVAGHLSQQMGATG
ncbi:IclR family transcriptional regulator (plasmid) [Agrobacterium tumefaciens]|nr:IclR family transcriptional regulator [Agrobacterium tumefaciens]